VDVIGEYVQNDIQSNFSGDISIGNNGDIKLAGSYDTQVALANFWLRTDNSDYAPAPDVGANLGEFIGENNTRQTLQQMEEQTNDSLVRNIFFPEDVAVKVIPFDYDEALVAVQLAGDYFESGSFRKAVPTVFSYLFPYIDGAAIPSEI